MGSTEAIPIAMFRQKRVDTTVGSIESTYGICLNCRRDMLLGNLLKERGFDSLSQLLRAYKGQLTSHARRRKLFLSFHYEDRLQVQGFKLMAHNPNLDFDFHDTGLAEAVNSDRSSYIRGVIAEKIRRSSVVVCLIGNGTAWRSWVNWEIAKASELGKGICGIRLKDSRGTAPSILREVGARISPWDPDRFVAEIEYAAARRS
jgi:hypothetical protein